jgi:phosphoesterase RecJ-like protein
VKEQIAAAARVLRRAERVGALGHVGPDGDALGASWAIALAARDAGKEAYASFGEPFVIPAQFSFLPHDVVVRPSEFPADLDVVVACDTASADRLGSLAPKAAGAGHLIVIDHHRSNGGFGDIQVVDPDAAATTQIVFYLLEALGWDLTPEIASCLYTGLVTDTGRFQYSATSPEVHRVAGSLIAAGADPATVNRHVYEEAPFGYLRLAATVLGRARLDPDRALVWSVVTKQDLEEAEVAYEDAEGLIDLLRLPEEAEVACLLKRLTDDATRGSLRSRGAVDVSAVAVALGGGGHHNASGFTVAADPEETLGRVLAELDRLRG